MSFDFIFHRKVMLSYFFKQTCNSFCIPLFLCHSVTTNTVIVPFCTKPYILLQCLGVCLIFTFFFSENVFGKRIKFSFSDKEIIQLKMQLFVWSTALAMGGNDRGEPLAGFDWCALAIFLEDLLCKFFQCWHLVFNVLLNRDFYKKSIQFTDVVSGFRDHTVVSELWVLFPPCLIIQQIYFL